MSALGHLDHLLPLRIRTTGGPRRGRAVDGQGGRSLAAAFAEAGLQGVTYDLAVLR
jgi:hypothetical protein